MRAPSALPSLFLACLRMKMMHSGGWARVHFTGYLNASVPREDTTTRAHENDPHYARYCYYAVIIPAYLEGHLARSLIS